MPERTVFASYMTICICVLGLLFWLYAWINMRRKRWLEREAKILSLDMPPQFLSKEPSKTSRTGHSIEIEYSYIFEEKRYTSRRKTPMDVILMPSKHFKFARSLHSAWLANKPIKVYVNEQNPLDVALAIEISFLPPIVAVVAIIGMSSYLYFK